MKHIIHTLSLALFFSVLLTHAQSNFSVKLALGETYSNWQYVTNAQENPEILPYLWTVSDWPTATLTGGPGIGIGYTKHWKQRWQFTLGLEWQAIRMEGNFSHASIDLFAGFTGLLHHVTIPLEMKYVLFSHAKKGQFLGGVGAEVGYTFAPYSKRFFGGSDFLEDENFFRLVGQFESPRFPILGYRVQLGWQAPAEWPVYVGITLRHIPVRAIGFGVSLYTLEDYEGFGIPPLENQLYAYSNHLGMMQLQMEARFFIMDSRLGRKDKRIGSKGQGK